MTQSAIHSALNVPEITKNIIYYLTHGWLPNSPFKLWGLLPHIAQYATVNRTWQDMVESLVFATLHLDLKRLSNVASTMTSRRRGYVREIYLDIRLEKPVSASRDENDEEKLLNNHVMQTTFEAFLNCLSTWEENQVCRDGVKVQFEVFAQTDYIHFNASKSSVAERKLANRLAHRHKSSVLELEDPARLEATPPVKVVSQVKMKNMEIGRRVSGKAVCGLLARLHSAKKITFRWGDADWRPDVRREFAEALYSLKQPMDELIISGFPQVPSDMEPWEMPEADNISDDPLSKVLCGLAQRLEAVDFYGMIVGNEIFSTQAPFPAPEHSPWARMKCMSLVYLPVTPSGEVLFVPDPNSSNSSDSESEDSASDASVDSSSEPPSTGGLATPAVQKFYLAAACAAAEMPVLKDMTLVAQLEPHTEVWHKFWYHVSGSRGKAIWTTSSEFVPENEVLDQWQQVTKRNLDSDFEYEMLNDEGAI